jgi:hypothetical protein
LSFQQPKEFLLISLDSDRSKKLGFDEYIQSDPCKFDHHDFFKALQTATLDYRLSDPYCSLVNMTHFSPLVLNSPFKSLAVLYVS